MNTDMHQIELTDQELEQVMGGAAKASPNYGLGYVGTGFNIGTGSTGLSGGTQSLGFAQGNTGALGFAHGLSFGNQLTGPAATGINDTFAYSEGDALGYGF
jgi:hypothetical protein